MTDGGFAAIAVEGIELPAPARLSLAAHLDAPFRVEATFVMSPPTTPFDALFGARAEVMLAATTGAPQRYLGVVDEIEASLEALRIVIVPRVAWLTSAVDHRVFVGKNALEIATAVLSAHGLALASRVGRALPARAQVVQDFESDLAFVSRVLAEEGLAWLVEPEGEEVVVVDGLTAPPSISGAPILPYADDGALLVGEAITSLSISDATAVDAVVLRDRDYSHPDLDLDVERGGDAARVRHYEHGGDYRSAREGSELAARRLEALASSSRVLRGTTTSARLVAGATFVLEGAPHPLANGAWLVVALEATAQAEGDTNARAFTATFVAIPAGKAYRSAPAPRATPGFRRATITGPRGAEIHTTELGEAAALLRFDRSGPSDETSSRPIRSLQPFTDGAMLLPRVGWEALVAFASHRGADEPQVLGRLDHGAARPAEALPAQKVRTAFGSRSTPGGGGSNVFGTDDAAGREGLHLGASKDHNELTAADKTVNVVASDSHAIGGKRDITVGNAFQIGVAGSQVVSVAGSKDVGVGAARVVDAASESVSVGGSRTLTIGGDHATISSSFTRVVGAGKAEVAVDSHHRHVSGISLVLAAASMSEDAGAMSMVGVLGLHLRASGGPFNIRTPSYAQSAAVITEDFGSHSASAGGKLVLVGEASASVKAGSASLASSGPVVVKADTKITINAGGASIEITPSSVTFKGPFKEGEDVIVLGSLDTE